jgi:two-component system sensor histidine kinase/response regulator
VTVAGDGAEAVVLVAEQPSGFFDLVLMDLHMPVLDGLEATRQLRALAQGQELPVVALTASALSEDRERCLAAGMNGHISKPLEPDELADVLRQLNQPAAASLERAGAQSSAAAPASSLLGLPELPGFDLQPLLDRVHNNKRMVWDLLEKFVAEEGVSGDELQALLQQGRLEEARQKTHSLVGSATAVGASLVSRSGAALYAALSTNRVTPAMVAELAEALKTSVTQVQSSLARRGH